jgi:dTDP-4-amino-4,6-dideoxygalactose transaminase
MPPIMALATAKGLKVVEDCALAVGARWQGRHVGLFGDAGCFSFYPVKHITTGEGGMFVSRHKAVAVEVAKLRAFGVDRTHTERAIPGMYDVPSLGLNYRMSEIQATIGRVQMSRIDENLAGRRARFEEIAAGLRQIPGVRVLDSTSAAGPNSHYCLSVVFEGGLATRRDEMVAQLNADGIGTSVYYPAPVPRLKYYSGKYGYRPSDFPNATEISDHSIALPVGWHIDTADSSYIVEQFGRAVKEKVS